MRTLQITTIFSILVLLSGTAVAADWPMFGHDPQHTGVAGESLEPPLEVLWKFGAGGEVGSPAVSRDTVYIGSSDNYVYALDADTGTEKWKFETGRQVLSSPAVYGGTVYIGSNDNYVYALDADTGTEKWKFETGGQIGSSPAVSRDTVYISSWDHYVYALDADTGTEKWKFETGSAITRSSPAVYGGTVYIGSGDNYVYALDADTGTEKWKFETGRQVLSSPAVYGGTVYIGAGDNACALDADTGTEKWKYNIGGGIGSRSSPAVSGDTVYIGSNDNYVYALDADTGAEKWKFETGGWIYSSPAVSGGTVYIESNDDYVYALDADTGTEKWKFKVGHLSYMVGLFSPVVSGGRLYVGADCRVYAFTTEVIMSAPAPTLELTPTPTAVYTPLPIATPHPTCIAAPRPTPAPTPEDTSPPAISILNPIIIEYNNNDVLEEGEKVTITYGANDPIGVTSIKILIDGTMLESRNGAGTYTVTTNSLPVGKHTIRVEATDSKSNTGFEELPITVERTGPSVYFGTTRTMINKGEDAIFTLSAVNPIGNPLMTVQLILKPPTGVSVTSSSFAKAGSGIYTCTQTIESGDNVRSIEVRLTGNEVGTHEIESEVYYMFEGSSKSPTRYDTLTLVVDDPDSTPLTPTPKPSPGFAAVIAITGLLAAYLRRRI